MLVNTLDRREPNLRRIALAQLRTKPVSTWAAKDWAAAKAAGITDGSAPQGLITRQEAVTMIQRATK